MSNQNILSEMGFTQEQAESRVRENVAKAQEGKSLEERVSHLEEENAWAMESSKVDLANMMLLADSVDRIARAVETIAKKVAELERGSGR